MTDLLNLLRDEANQLLEHELPTVNELRPIVGALAARLGRLEEKLVGDLEPAPVREPVEQPAAANTVQPSPSPAGDPVAAVQEAQAAQADAEQAAAAHEKATQDALAELAAAQKRVAELEANQGSQTPAPAPTDTSSQPSPSTSDPTTPPQGV
ncbi:MAG TPA: hypothetical protein VFP55_13625 [Solirubrobacteraceae bacterium]|nr:hypothetical protein [Solirubrobacteraceae bacterium]